MGRKSGREGEERRRVSELSLKLCDRCSNAPTVTQSWTTRGPLPGKDKLTGHTHTHTHRHSTSFFELLYLLLAFYPQISELFLISRYHSKMGPKSGAETAPKPPGGGLKYRS